MLRYLVLAGLFYALTPGVLVTLPKKSSKNTVALTHAVIYAGAYYVIEHLFRVKEGFQLKEVPAGADPKVVYQIQTANSMEIAGQMETEASTHGTTTPLYQSLTAIKAQYDAAARAAQYAATAAANESGGNMKVAIAAPNPTPIDSPMPMPRVRPVPAPDKVQRGNDKFDPQSPGAIALWVFIGLTAAVFVTVLISYARSARTGNS